MAYKDILVHVDDTKACEGRIKAAMALAEKHGAHLTALYVVPMPIYPMAEVMMAAPDLYEQQEEEAKVRAAAAKTAFEALTQGSSLSLEWRAQKGFPPYVVSEHGRYADLLVLGQFDPKDPAGSGDVTDQIILSVGRPALVIPYVGAGNTIPPQHVIVGWDASAHAARAIHDAMPLLLQAKTVEVVAVNPQTGAGAHGDVPGSDISHHLARHGVKAEAHSLSTHDVSPGDMLLARIADTGADLFVMGAYGHSRVRELVLGGVTKRMLEQMTVPTFMAH